MKKFQRKIVLCAMACTMLFGMKQVSAAQTTENKTTTTTAAQATTEEEKVTFKKKTATVYCTKELEMKAEPDADAKKVETTSKYKMYHLVAVGSNGWDKIQRDNKECGYIQHKYLTTKKPSRKKNIVDAKDGLYTYANMASDLKEMNKYYPDWTELKVLGKTADNRKIYCLILGNPKAKKQILIQSSIHAREYLNTKMVMESLEKYVVNYEKGSYGGKKYSKMFDKVAVYVIPMINPDGVTISQKGIKGIQSATLRKKIKKMSKSSYRTWKANARGVDLNRNWSYGFGIGSKRGPSSNGYAGKSAYSEKETKAVKKLVDSLKNPKAVISFHSMGRILYWDFGQSGSYRSRCKKLYNAVKSLNHYSFAGRCGKNGGFGEWCVRKKGIPQITVETGSSACPLPKSAFSSIYSQNKNMIGKVAKLYY